MRMTLLTDPAIERPPLLRAPVNRHRTLLPAGCLSLEKVSRSTISRPRYFVHVLFYPQGCLENCAGANYALQRTALGLASWQADLHDLWVRLSGPTSPTLTRDSDAAHGRTAPRPKTPHE